jgi:DNA-binding NtrC family response regulator
VTGISGEAVAYLSQLDWPGNIRQLENAVYRAVVMSEGDQLGIADFPLIPAHAPAPVEHAPPLLVERPSPFSAPTVVSGNEIPIAPSPAPIQPGTLSMLSASGEVRPLEELEHEIIRFAIAHYRGQMSEVARRLKIGRSTLYRKLDEASGPDTAGQEAPTTSHSAE